MSATDKANTSVENFELTPDILETVSGGEINVAETIFMDRLISSTKDRGETLDDLIDLVHRHNGVSNAAELKGIWAWIANAEPEKVDEIIDYFKQNW